MGVLLTTPSGEQREFSDEEAAVRLKTPGYKPVGAAARVESLGNEQLHANVPIGDSLALGAANGATFGLATGIARARGDEDTGRYIESTEGEHPLAYLGGNVVGALATEHIPGMPANLVSKFGRAISTAGEGASAATQVARAAAGVGAEGAAYGLGQGGNELSMSRDSLSVERAASVLTSNMAFGGVVGAAAGTLGKVAELGINRVRGGLDKLTDQVAARNAAADEFSNMNSGQLKEAETTEVTRLKAEHQDNLATIESKRATERSQLADDLHSLKQEVEDTKQLVATGPEAAPAQARQAFNPADVATKPEAVVTALRHQEHALTQIMDQSEELRVASSGDALGNKRIEALDAVPGLLERNQAIQARIAELKAPLPSAPTTSPTLDRIAAAKSYLAEHGTKGHEGVVDEMLKGTLFGKLKDAAETVSEAIPIPGLHHLAAFAAAKGSKFITEQVLGRLGKAVGAVGEHSAGQLAHFLDTGAKVATLAPPLATRVLAQVRFAPPRKEAAEGGGETLASSFKARSEELRSQMTVGPDGKAQMRPDARAVIADNLRPIAVKDPALADKIEAIKARSAEFLADKLPRKPDLAGIPLGGPDRWRPTDLQIRTFARYVSAVENPGGVEQRLAHGIITPEDAEAYKTVYPEMYQHMVQNIMQQLPNLRKELPFQKRLALSIFTDQAVDPSFDPRILQGLQAQFAQEPGTNGGQEAPTAQANFGSLGSAKSQEKATAAQERAG